MTNTPQQTIYFVGGAPRSGTTVTHALLCTSARTNPYTPEISFIRPLFTAYAAGINNWGGHTNAFFEKQAHFDLHMRKIVEGSLAHVSRVLKDPEILAVKDPLLTPFFPWVRRLLGERARFVTVVRHPYSVVRSRQEVIERSDQPFNEAQAARTAREYVRTYAHLDLPGLAPALHHLRYEDLDNPETVEGLRAFTGLDDLSPDNIWGKKRAPRADAASTDPWFSPKYHGAIDTKSRLDPLAPAYCRVVDRICAPLMERFGYERQG